MYDEWQLYCDRCAHRVEIKHSDPVARQLADDLSAHPQWAGDRVAHLRAMERQLKPCSCGGRFRHDAPRRCHACHTVVLADAPDTDLWPGVFGADGEDHDLTPEEIRLAAEFEQVHVHRGDIWLLGASGCPS